MLPADLPLVPWVPSPDGPRTIVVLTGRDLRHDRFALRMIEEFGDKVVAWYRLCPNAASVVSADPVSTQRERMLGLWRSMVQQHGTLGAAGQLPAQIRRLRERRRILRAREQRQRTVEKEMFGAEVERLGASSHLQPVDVVDPNAASFVEIVRENSPWLLLTLGGPLYRRPLLAAARGGTINQHAGWSPDYRGTNTTDWTLYHRQLGRVGSTVHISATGADSGGILRRSHPCLSPDDTPESIFARVVALGTELVIETVEELLQEGRTLVAEQPTDRGRTYLSRDLEPAVLIRSAQDFESGWLNEALTRETRW